MELTKELAYILGALRDGSVLKYSDKEGKIHHYITVYSKDVRWLKTVSKMLSKVFKKTPYICIPNSGTPYTRIYSKPIAELIKNKFEHPLTSQIKWKTPRLVKKSKNPNMWKWYIAGFWDAEGSFDIRTKQIRFHLSWDGNECLPLVDIKDKLKKLGIKTGKVGKYENRNGNYPRFVLRLCKKDNKKFLDIVPIKNDSKKMKMRINGVTTAK